MNKKLIIFLIFGTCILLLAAAIGGFLVWQNNKSSDEAVIVESLSLDPQKEATHISKVAGTDDAYFIRGFDIIWNSIEPKEGVYDFKETDQRLLDESKSDEDIYHLSIIWPYANWDQNTCHKGDKYLATGHLKRGGEDLMMGAPCDYDKYQTFLKKVIERYDGDGVEDMPGLQTPVKYWEVLNEPSMHGGSIGGAGEDLKFFVGTSEEYLEILKTSYLSIKQADPDSKVLHAGMAGMQQNFQDFWTPIFKGGAANYFDIANIHSISTDERTEDLFLISFKRYLESFGIKDKPIWVTEAQYGDLQGKPKDISNFEKMMARSAVFSLSQGADKIFFIENWTMWDEEEPPMLKDKKEGIDYMEEKDEGKFKKKEAPDTTTHKVYSNLVNKLGSFDKVVTISEDYIENKEFGTGASSNIGQYKFTKGDEVIYVLWGGDKLPTEITGIVTVTDIYGVNTDVDSSSIELTDSPIFVELK